MTLVLGLVLLGVLLVFAYLFNHALARIAFTEMALTNGLPTTTSEAAPSTSGGHQFQPDVAAERLPPTAVNVFAHASCATCIRLVDELASPDVSIDTPLHVYFDTLRPPLPRGSAIEHEYQHDLVDAVSIPATPYAVITVDGEVASHGTVPNPKRLQSLMVLAGLSDRLPVRLLASETDRVESAAQPVGPS